MTFSREICRLRGNAAASAEAGRRMDDFREPGRAFFPRPLLFLSGRPERGGIRRLLAGCAEYGYGGVGPIPYRDTGMEYLGEEYFRMYGMLLEEAEAAGLKLCCYDEWWFPSGSAGGLFGEKFPEYGASRLDLETQPLSAGANPLPEKPGVLMAAVAMERQSLERVAVTDRCAAETLFWDRPGDWELMRFYCRMDRPRRVNYLEPQAVEKFLSLTHEQYFRRFAPYFGTVIDSSFYDEPQFYSQQGRSWTADFNRKFRERYGCDPSVWYPALWRSIGEDTAAARNLLLSFRADLYAEGFPKTVQKWCTAHGISLMGHVDQEEAVNPCGITGDLMKSFRYQEIPGVDEIFTPGRASRIFKIISSAAYNWDRQLVMCECFGAIPGLTETQMYAEVLDLYAKGVNLLVPHAVWYDAENVHFPPELSWRTPEYAGILKPFNRFCARLSMVLQGGGHVSEVAVIYPIAGLQARYSFSWYAEQETPDYTSGGPAPRECDYQEIGEELFYGCSCDFTFLHPDRIAGREDAEISRGRLRLLHTRHRESYSVVLLTGQDAISVQTLEKLLLFAESGGTVISTSALPRFSAEPGQNARVRFLVKKLFGCSETPSAVSVRHFPNGGAAFALPFGDRNSLREILRRKKRDIFFENRCPGLGYLHKTSPEQDVYFFVNRTPESIRTDFDAEDCSPAASECWDPETGAQTAWPLSRSGGRLRGNLILPAGRALFLVLKKT